MATESDLNQANETETDVEKDVTQQEQRDDIRSDVEKAFEAFEKKETDESDKPVAEKKTVEKAEKEEKTDKQPVATDKQHPTTEKPLDPNVKWAQKDKEYFKTLPRPAQDFILRREKEMQAGLTQATQAVASLKRDFEPVQNMLAPHAEAMRARGFTPESLIKAWMNVEDALLKGGESAVDVLAKVIQNYRIDPQAVLKALNGGGQQQQQQTGEQRTQQAPLAQLPPEVQAKLRELDDFKNSSIQERQQEMQRNREVESAKIMKSIEEFKAAADDKGNLLHPHFDAVEEVMTGMVIAARQMGQDIPPLDKLYESAVYSNPTTRAELLTAQKQSEEKARAQEARNRSVQARRAGSSVTGSPGSGQTTARKGNAQERSRREELEAAYDEVVTS